MPGNVQSAIQRHQQHRDRLEETISQAFEFRIVPHGVGVQALDIQADLPDHLCIILGPCSNLGRLDLRVMLDPVTPNTQTPALDIPTVTATEHACSCRQIMGGIAIPVKLHSLPRLTLVQGIFSSIGCQVGGRPTEPRPLGHGLHASSQCPGQDL